MYPVHRAKTNLSKLIRKACAGDTVVLARGQEPMLPLVPVRLALKKRVPGGFVGKIFALPEAGAAMAKRERAQTGTAVVSILLDTHVLLCWLGDRKRPTFAALSAKEGPANKACVSAVSVWEMTIKQCFLKLHAGPILADFERALEGAGFAQPGITVRHARHVASEKSANRNPFDQWLAAQAQCKNLSMAGSDKFLDKQAVQRIW
jgi:PIN domain nuclease of toxin-antitoxin system/antitoxin (DNA-binding transcriptional repressor) of toxin-antitoxin stability system